MDIRTKCIVFLSTLLSISALVSTGCMQQSDESRFNQSTLQNDSTFGDPISLGKLQANEMNEVSGIAVSRHNHNFIWAHNDSGGDPQLFLVDKEGNLSGTFHLSNATNRDWEDMAIGPGPDSSETYLYIADFGDNDRSEEILQIYRTVEPAFDTTASSMSNTLKYVDKLEFQYPEGRSYNAETLLLDPESRDLFIVTKNEYHEKVFRLSFPQKTSQVDTAKHVGTIPFSGMVGGDISADGRIVLMKTLQQVLIWHLDAKDSPASITDKIPGKLPYRAEPQGEALGIAPDLSAYFTISETAGGANPHVYFYPHSSK